MFFFAKVDDGFEISGKGRAVAHTQPTSLLKGECIVARDNFDLRKPDGTSFRTYFIGSEFHERPRKGSAANIL